MNYNFTNIKPINKIKIFSSSLNLIIRACSIALKSIAVIWLSNSMSVSDYSDYGIFNGFSNFLIIIIGFDIYKIYQRNNPTGSFKEYLAKSQILFYFKIYILVFILAACLCVFNKSFLFFWLAMIVISEHFIQELYRMFVFVNRIIPASLLLLLKSVFFISYILIKIKFLNDIISYVDIIIFWAISNLIIVILIFLMSTKLGVSLNSTKLYSLSKLISFKNISLIFISSILLRSIITIDKYIFSLNASDSSVASYVLLISICSLFLVVFDSVYLSFNVPDIMKASDNDLTPLFKQFFFKGVMCLLFLFFGAEVLLSFSYFTDMLDLYTNRYEYTLGLIAFLILSISGLLDVYIVRSRLDTKNLIVSLISSLVFFILCISFPAVNLEAMLFILILTFALLLILKSIIVVRKIT